MEFLLLIATLIICFFILYVLCRQDFVLLRENISLAQILDVTIITVIIAFIAGRLLYVINSSEIALLHVIRFFHFIKFPGISAIGFFIGASIALWILLRHTRGILRVFDIFSISFLPLYVLSLATKDYPEGLALILPFSLSILLALLFAFFLKSHYQYFLKDGTIALLFLLVISLDSLLYDYIKPARHIFLELSMGQILGIVFASSALVFIFINQKKLKI